MALAGAFGTAIRYGLNAFSGSFPFHTLGINTVGSGLMGFLFGAGADRFPRPLFLALTVGLLGGFTTYSSFNQETINLVRNGRSTPAVLYVLGTLALGFAAGAVGMLAGRMLFRR